MKIELSGDFLKAEECKGGEICEILDNGEMAEIQSPEGKVKKVINFRIKVEGEDKTYTPNRATLTNFVDAWKDESDFWVGNKFTIELANVNIFGKVKKSIIGKPLLESK